LEDSFLTIAAASKGLYKDKGSKFMAFAYPVNAEDEIREKVDALRKKYFDARHHCFAWRLGANGEHYRVNDDGEPSNSAGKPILGQIISCELTNVLVVVVRYFGGVLLGVGGLMHAYKQATFDALSHAEIVSGIITESYLFTFDYSDMNRILKVVKDMDLECTEQHFNLNCSMRVKVRKNLSASLLQKLERVESLTVTAY
jgi:uncharacterized YigZ family protein